jgi:hypothetical protein
MPCESDIYGKLNPPKLFLAANEHVCIITKKTTTILTVPQSLVQPAKIVMHLSSEIFIFIHIVDLAQLAPQSGPFLALVLTSGKIML